jgi:hypothetical protein
VSDDHLSPAAVRVAVGLVVLLAVGVVVAGLVLSPDGDETADPAPTNTRAPRTGPLALAGVDAPDARSASCTGLLTALPKDLADGGDTLATLPLADPAPPAATAWGGDGGEPVVLRCGLPRPDELTPTSALREISGVRWLPVEGDGSATWYVVDRAVYVALTVPAGSGTGPLQDISAATARTLPEKPVRANG